MVFCDHEHLNGPDVLEQAYILIIKYAGACVIYLIIFITFMGAFTR